MTEFYFCSEVHYFASIDKGRCTFKKLLFGNHYCAIREIKFFLQTKQGSSSSTTSSCRAVVQKSKDSASVLCNTSPRTAPYINTVAKS